MLVLSSDAILSEIVIFLVSAALRSNSPLFRYIPTPLLSELPLIVISPVSAMILKVPSLYIAPPLPEEVLFVITDEPFRIVVPVL